MDGERSALMRSLPDTWYEAAALSARLERFGDVSLRIALALDVAEDAALSAEMWDRRGAADARRRWFVLGGMSFDEVEAEAARLPGNKAERLRRSAAWMVDPGSDPWPYLGRYY